MKVEIIIEELIRLTGIYPRHIELGNHTTGDDQINAEVTYDRLIRITPAAVENLTELEVKSIILHELGHIALGHLDYGQYLYFSNEVHKKMELDADLYALKYTSKEVMISQLFKSHVYPMKQNDLSSPELIRLALDTALNEDSDSHPSCVERMNNIWEAII